MNGAAFFPTHMAAPRRQPPTILRPVGKPGKEERPGFSASVDSSVARANRVLREHRESAFPRALDLPVHARNNLDARSCTAKKRAGIWPLSKVRCAVRARLGSRSFAEKAEHASPLVADG